MKILALAGLKGSNRLIIAQKLVRDGYTPYTFNDLLVDYQRLPKGMFDNVKVVVPDVDECGQAEKLVELFGARILGISSTGATRRERLGADSVDTKLDGRVYLIQEFGLLLNDVLNGEVPVETLFNNVRNFMVRAGLEEAEVQRERG